MVKEGANEKNMWKEECVKQEILPKERRENSNVKWIAKYESEFATFFASKTPFVSDEQFQLPNIRNKPAREQQQQPINGANERTEKDSGADKDVIITGVSTYAEAAKVSCNNQLNAPGISFFGKRVNFNKTKPKQKQSNVQNQPATSQSNTNLRPPPPRPPLLHTPHYQQNDRAPAPKFTTQNTNRIDTNPNLPQESYNPNRGYNPNFNRDPFLYPGPRAYQNP